MFKTIAATALSAAIALAALAPTPAQAMDQRQLTRLLVGIGAAALIAKAVQEQNKRNDRNDRKERDDRKDRDDRDDWNRKYQAYRYNDVPVGRQGYYAPPPAYRPHTPYNRAIQQPYIKPVPKAQREKNQRTVPEACQRMFREGKETRGFLTGNCLERSGIRTAALPGKCERILDMPGNREDRRVWSSNCLKKQGYKVR